MSARMVLGSLVRVKQHQYLYKRKPENWSRWPPRLTGPKGTAKTICHMYLCGNFGVYIYIYIYRYIYIYVYIYRERDI